MSDVYTILRLYEAVKSDPDRPCLEQEFNVFDPVSIEIVLHEADHLVVTYMEKFRAEYIPLLEDQTLFDKFLLEYQLVVRRDLKAIIASAAQKLRGIQGDPDEEDEEEENGQGCET